MRKFGILFASLLVALLALGVAAFGSTLPSTANLQFQTSSRERPPTIGDWYTTTTSGSTDRVHRIVVEVTQALLNAQGGTVQVQVFDAESNGNLDEVFNTPDPSRFELRASNGTTILQSQNVASGAADGTTVTFTINAVGSYQLVAMNGAFPINGTTTAALNDDDNTYSVSIPGATTVIGQFQGTFSPTSAISNLRFYFLAGPGTPDLRLRNFDMDGTTGSPQVTYTRPSGANINGTTSGNGVWNGPSGTLNAGEDTISMSTTSPFPDAGQWGITLSSINSGNQFILEANAGTNRLVILDTPPSTLAVGNFTITPDGTLPGIVGSATDHPFTITNYFYTNDIINLNLTGTGANYTTQLLDSSGNPLTDLDGDGKVDTGIMTPSQSKNFILRVTPNPGAANTDTTRINATSFMNTRVSPTLVSTLFVNKTTQLTYQTNISGTVYNDANHNGSLDATETGLATTNYFVKLVPAAGGNAVIAAAVNPSNGTYSFLNVATGSYTLVLDDNGSLTDTTPSQPAGTVGTEAPLGTRSITVPNQGLINQNFGRYQGVLLSGRVFRDNGSPSGTPNDGILTTENGIASVGMKITNNAGTVTYDTAVTDGSGNYSMYVPVIGTPVRVVETNLSGYRSTGGQVGNTGGTYSLANDAVTFTVTGGTTYTNVNFGDVPYSTLTEDNVRVVAPGDAVIMPHVFTAGTAGSLTFNLSQVNNPANGGWNSVLYQDSNNDGVFTGADSIITTSIPVVAGQAVRVFVKTYSPANASLNAQDAITFTANLTYTNQTSIVETLTRNDLVTVSRQDGLILTKAVDRTTARAGDDITYTITYQNTGNGPITNLIISDTTPAFCVYRSATNGTLPTALTGVTRTNPAVNASGALKWTFTGSLNAGQQGSVTFVVRLQ